MLCNLYQIQLQSCVLQYYTPSVMCPSLLTLYDSILVPLLCEWICADSVCALDTAVCNRNLRANFLTILRKCSIGIESQSQNAVYSWMVLRCLKLTRVSIVSIDNELCCEELSSLLSKTHHFEFIKAPFEENIKYILDGKSINRLCLTSSKDIDDLNVIRTIFHSVCHLDISKADVDDSSFQVIADYAPNLKSILLGTQYDMNGLSIFHHVSLTVQTRTLNNVTRSNLFYTVHSHPSYYCCDDVPSWVFRVDGVAYEMTELATSLSVNNVSEMELSFIAPCIERLTSVTFNQSSPQNLMKLIVSKCRMLKSFKAMNIYIEETGLVTALLNSSKSLTDLVLTRVNLTSSALERIATYCCQLETIVLENIDVSSSIASLFKSNCANLWNFRIDSTNKTFSSSGLAVGLHNAVFMTSGVCALQELRDKRSLYTTCPLFQSEEFYALNPSLLYLSMHSSMDERMVSFLVKSCRFLKSLEMCPWTSLSVKSVRLLASCKNLSTLIMDGVSGLSDEDFELLLCDKPYFEVLELHGCSGFTEHVCQIIAKYCRFLKRLRIAHKHITDDDAQHLVDSCKKLKRLDLRGSSVLQSKLIFR